MKTQIEKNNMSREFKFRIYSFLDKEFHYFNIYEGVPQGIAGGVSEPQQYTEFKDIKANPIYEGDILKFTARRKLEDKVPVINYAGSYGCIVTDETDFKEFLHLSDIVQQYYPRIIGSIYDNDIIIQHE